MTDDTFMHPDLRIILEAQEKASAPGTKIWVGDLKTGDMVEVKTKRTVYVLKVIDPSNNLVEATSNGESITSPEVFRVLGPIVVDQRLLLESKDENEDGLAKRVDTSGARRITINGKEVE